MIALRGRNLSHDIAAQYRISGQPSNEILPGGKFPHASLYHSENSSRPRTQRNLADELANTRPSLCAATKSGPMDANSRSSTAGLKQHHLVTLNATMHKCLLKGDYARASRAWGMLLRAEQGGHSFDLRTHDRWAFGAEFLLQRRAQCVKSSGEAVEVMGRHLPCNPSTGIYSIQDLEQAKDYYERLVLQYPYRKAFPSAIGPQQFYLAMFGLWINAIKEQHSSIMAVMEKGIEGAGELSDLELKQSYERSVISPELPKHEQVEVVRQDILQRAYEVAGRLKELLNSPPYSDNARFWELLGMVNLWIWDLSLSGADADVEDDPPKTEGSSMSGGLGRDYVLGFSRSSAQKERDNAFTDARKALQKAGSYSTKPT